MGNILIKNALGSLAAVLAGGVFIFSAITKLMPIEAFEISLVDVGLCSFHFAPTIARLLIGVEFVLGTLLIFHFQLRRLIIPAAVVLLAIFTVYLVYLIKVYGNRGSCGCFGTVIEITPLEGIAKNVGLLGILLLAYLWAPAMAFKHKTFAAGVLAVALMVLPFAINPMTYPFRSIPFNEFKRFPIDTVGLYSKPTAEVDTQLNVMHGKHIVAMLSASCEHCRLVAKKLVVYEKQSPSLPLVFVMYNNKEMLPVFYADTKADSIPTILINDKQTFVTLTGNQFPRVYWVSDGVVQYETNFYELDKAKMDDWLSH